MCPPVPGERVVYFHVGGHKTGTTYLQNVLWHNRAALRRDGLLYPGRRQGAHIWANHDLRQASFKGYRAPQVAGAWRRIVDEIEAWDGAAVIDHEMFSLATPQHIERALNDLAFAEVRIVFTARDMARQIPAVWQEWVKNRATLSYAEFLTAIRGDTAEAARLWALHDVPAILAKWSSPLGPAQVRLVTVPPPGADRGLLWERFAGVLGVEPARYATDIGAANSSLGAAEATVIRRLNAELADVAQPVYDRAVKFHLATRLSARPGNRIDLPADAYEWAVGRAHETVAAFRAAGYRVVGDLDELIPAARPTGSDPDAVPVEEQAAAAIAGMAALVRWRRPASGELRRLRARVAELERSAGSPARDTPGPADGRGLLRAARDGLRHLRRAGDGAP